MLLDLIHAVPTLAEKGTGLKLKVAGSEMQSRLTIISSTLNEVASTSSVGGMELMRCAACECDQAVDASGSGSARLAQGRQFGLLC